MGSDVRIVMIKLIISDESAAVLLLLLRLARQRSLAGLLLPLVHCHAFKHHFRQQFEYAIDVAVVFCAGLQELYAVLLSQSQSLLVRDLPLSLKITLGSNQYHVNLCLPSLSYLVDPGLDVVEADWVGDGVGKDDAMCPLVEGLGDIAESLLASRIPDVECDLAALHLHALDLEVHSDGAQVLGLEGILAVANQQTSLAHSAITYNQVLDSHSFLCHNHYIPHQAPNLQSDHPIPFLMRWSREQVKQMIIVF